MTYLRISPRVPKTTIVLASGFASFKSPYPEPYFLEALKQKIPAGDRRWDGASWIVPAQHTDILAAMVEKYYGSRPEIEQAAE